MTFAEVIVHEIISDFPELRRSPTEVAHITCAAANMMGVAMHAATGKEKPIFVEIGTQIGISTRALLLVAERMDGHVTSMDIDPTCGEGKLRKWVEDRGLGDRWTFLAGPSQAQAPIPNADFLLVDGNHDYDAVCEDMIVHGSAVKNGAVILLDDYHVQFPGKLRWVQERWKELQPLTIGPWALLIKRPGDEAHYQKKFEGDSWFWSLE